MISEGIPANRPRYELSSATIAGKTEQQGPYCNYKVRWLPPKVGMRLDLATCRGSRYSLLLYQNQCCGSGFTESGSSISSESGSGSKSGTRVLMTKNWTPKLQETRTLKDEIFEPFSIFMGNFLPSGSGSGLRIRIQGPHWSTTLIRTRYDLHDQIFQNTK